MGNLSLSLSGVTFMGSVSTYATYAEMLAKHKTGTYIQVLDASGDDTVESGSAQYQFVPPSAGAAITASNFVKIAESESVNDMATVTASINAINAKIGTGFTADATIADAFDAIDALIGEGFTAEDTIADAISAVDDKVDAVVTDKKFIIVSAATDLVVGKKYITKVASACTLPTANLADGDAIEIGTTTGVTTSTVVLAAGATDTLNGATDPITLSTANSKITLVYDLAATNWMLLNA